MIWIVGSSLIRNASQHIRRRPVGLDLGLKRYCYLDSWDGRGSLILDEVIGVTKTLLQIEYAPNYFVLHAAGNDLGRSSCLDMCNKPIGPEGIIDQLRILMPYTTIVWSYILPRLQWRYSRNTKAMENVCIRVSRELIRFMKVTGGKAIRYHDFHDKSPSLLSDGTHLSFIGNDIFVNTFQSAFEMFIPNPNIRVFPFDELNVFCLAF